MVKFRLAIPIWVLYYQTKNIYEKGLHVVCKKRFFGYMLFLVCSFSTNIWTGEHSEQDFLGEILGAKHCKTGALGLWLEELSRDCTKASQEAKERSKKFIDTVRRQVYLQAQASRNIEAALECEGDISEHIADLQKETQSRLKSERARHRKAASELQKAENLAFLASLACGSKDKTSLPAGGLGGPPGEGLGGGGSGAKPSKKTPRTGSQEDKPACKTAKTGAATKPRRSAIV